MRCIAAAVALAGCIGCWSSPSQAETQALQRDPPRQIKWHPGHYMASGSIMSAGRTVSYVRYEMDDLNHRNKVLGYRAWFTWGALEPTRGKYDFSVVDSLLARLKTAYDRPKRLVIGLWLYGQHPLEPNDARIIPLYIQQDPSFGASPVAGSYGWWGQSANGKATGMYALALYYPPVMDRFIALVQALGRHLDSEGYFEALVIQEDATLAQAASAFPPVDPNYSDDAWLAQLERLLTAAVAAFPHTSVVMQNTWFDRPRSGVALEQWMANHRIASGSPDSWGQSSISKYGTAKLSDGIKTLIGADPLGGTADLRAQMGAMMEVQSPDMMGTFFESVGGPWTPIDFINAFNQTYKASHVFWTHLAGSESLDSGGVPPPVKWSNLAPVLDANPLINTGYPANYP